jgi:hypothetical protein
MPRIEQPRHLFLTFQESANGFSRSDALFYLSITFRCVYLGDAFL